MLLRMYELATSDLDRAAGWPAMAGHYAGGWPRAAFPSPLAIELAVATSEEASAGDADARPGTACRLIPWLVDRLTAALEHERPAGLALVARLDGYMRRGGLVEAVQHLGNDDQGVDGPLFRLSASARLSARGSFPPASLSMTLDAAALAGLCDDPTLRLDGAVRMRLFLVAREHAATLVDCTALDDSRWPGVLAATRLYLSTSASLRSVFVAGPSDAEWVRQALVSPARA